MTPDRLKDISKDCNSIIGEVDEIAKQWGMSEEIVSRVYLWLLGNEPNPDFIEIKDKVLEMLQSMENQFTQANQQQA